MKKVFSILLVIVSAISNAQPVVHNHDLNLGPDKFNCSLDTIHYNPFEEFPAHAQTLSYTTSVIPYSPDTNNLDSILTGFTDDCNSKNIPIGFKFTYFGVSYNYFHLSSNAFMFFGNPPQNPNSVNFPQGNGCVINYVGCNTNGWNTNGSGSLGQISNSLPTNTIFFGGLDLIPLLGGQIKYSLSGVAPFRKLTIKYINVPYFSCQTFLYNAQVTLFETTNIIEIHIKRKESCTWNSNLAIIGLQGQFTNMFKSVTGYNNQSFQFSTSKAWRFDPSYLAPVSVNSPIIVKWKKLPNGPITYSHGLDILPNVNSGCYTAQIVRNNATYTALPCMSNTTPDTICIYPNTLSSNISPGVSTCLNTCNGQVNISVTTGTSPWTYDITSLSSSSFSDSFVEFLDSSHAFSNLCIGNYVIGVHDSLGCAREDSINITSAQPITISVINNAFCDGDSVTINSNASVGSTYQWQLNGNILSGDTLNQLLTNVTGNYTLFVTDTNDCSTYTNTLNIINAILTPPTIYQFNDTLYTGIFNSYQWYLNDSIIPGANAYNYFPTETGFYKVQTDSSGCSAFSQPFNFIYVGINKNRSSNFSYDVYPNPFNNTLTIKSNNKLDKATLRIVNVAGKMVYQSNILKGNETNIDVSELSKGIYIIELINNGAVERRKLIKE